MQAFYKQQKDRTHRIPWTYGILFFVAAAVMTVLEPAPLLAAQTLHKGQELRLSRRARILPQPRKGRKKLYPKGTIVKVLRLRGKRALVTTPDHRRGWFPKKILIPVNAATAQKTPPSSPKPPPPPPPSSDPLDSESNDGLQRKDLPVAGSEASSASLLHRPQDKASASTANKKESGVVRVAVYAFKLHDISPRIGRIVGQTLTAVLRKLKGLEVIGVTEILAMLDHETNKQLLGCEQDSCAAEIAGALGVDEIIVGDLSRLGDKSAISLRRLNLKQAKAMRSYELRMTPHDGEEFLSILGDAVETLYPKNDLLPGKKHGVDERMIAAMNPPPLPSWVFGTTGATAATLLLAGAAGSVGAFFAYEKYNSLASSSLDTPLYAEDLDRLGQQATAWDLGRWSLLGGAGVLLVVAGFEAILTDWQGLAGVYDEADLDKELAAP